MEHGWGINSREQMLENGDVKFKAALESFEMKMKAAWGRKRLKLWKRNQVGDSTSMDC